MWSIFFHVTSADHDTLVADLWERGTAGILEEAGGLRAFFEDTTNPADLNGLCDEKASHIRIETASEQCFGREDWEPILVGERFYIAPSWIPGQVPEGRVRLELGAATAFGTGRHETTQLCLEALERYLGPDRVVVDVGCGSGILSAAAHLLGATSIIGCDIDQEAIRTTRAHVGTPLFMGSADALAAECADLVVGNLTPAVLDRLAFDLRRITKPNGRVVISGFVAGAPPQYFEPEEALTRGDWLCWICRPNAITAPNECVPGGLSHEAEWWL